MNNHEYYYFQMNHKLLKILIQKKASVNVYIIIIYTIIVHSF